MMPAQLVCELQANNMMALSLGDDPADPNAEVLTKEYLWMDDDEEDNTPKNPKFFD